MVDTSDEWIVRRTGIRERRIAEKSHFTSTLCAGAALNLSECERVSLHDVDYIIVATSTPDYAFPSVAAMLQERLKIAKAGVNWTSALHVPDSCQR
jgi:3-oxoacyl-[acyl-carrier-protein] synthase III